MIVRHRHRAATLAAVVLFALAVHADSTQTGKAAGEPAFDAASVKPTQSGTPTVGWRVETGRFAATNVTLKQLISTAYGAPEQPLPDFQMSGGPSWLGTSRFDVIATSPGATPEQMRPMLRHLLEERFMLRTHFETHRRPIYALTLAHRNGSLGPRMRPSTTDCAALSADASARCGGGQIFPGTLTARGVSMARIASALARVMPGVNRPVIDRTGLTGLFDIDLTWTPVDLPRTTPAAGTPPIDPNGPDLFTALREQWGLTLNRETGPVPVLVIDGVSLPSEN